MSDDLISRQAAIEAIRHHREAVLGDNEYDEGVAYGYAAAHRHIIDIVNELPPAQPEDWMERNKERILQAGMKGQEVEFRIGGRLFAIREKAQ